MTGAGSRWGVVVSVAVLACLVLQACTAELWQETLEPECRKDANLVWRVGFAVLMTPFTLAFDAALFYVVSYSRGPC